MRMLLAALAASTTLMAWAQPPYDISPYQGPGTVDWPPPGGVYQLPGYGYGAYPQTPPYGGSAGRGYNPYPPTYGADYGYMPYESQPAYPGYSQPAYDGGYYSPYVEDMPPPPPPLEGEEGGADQPPPLEYGPEGVVIYPSMAPEEGYPLPPDDGFGFPRSAPQYYHRPMMPAPEEMPPGMEGQMSPYGYPPSYGSEMMEMAPPPPGYLPPPEWPTDYQGMMPSLEQPDPPPAPMAVPEAPSAPVMPSAAQPSAEPPVVPIEPASPAAQPETAVSPQPVEAVAPVQTSEIISSEVPQEAPSTAADQPVPEGQPGMHYPPPPGPYKGVMQSDMRPFSHGYDYPVVDNQEADAQEAPPPQAAVARMPDLGSWRPAPSVLDGPVTEEPMPDLPKE